LPRRQLQREYRAAAGRRAHGERRTEQVGQTLDDGQAQAQPLAVVRRQRPAALDLEELVEDARQDRLVDADAAVPYLKQQLARISGLGTRSPPARRRRRCSGWRC
jgi:hypothetical protein